MASQPQEADLVEFDWLQLHKDMNAMAPTENMAGKFMRKTRENPFVPLGVLATTAALGYGLWSFRQGRPKMSQYMMRARIGAQAFTIVALLVGLSYGIPRN